LFCFVLFGAGARPFGAGFASFGFVALGVESVLTATGAAPVKRGPCARIGQAKPTLRRTEQMATKKKTTTKAPKAPKASETKRPESALSRQQRANEAYKAKLIPKASLAALDAYEAKLKAKVKNGKTAKAKTRKKAASEEE
jgi:hypothetical protein